MSELVKKQIRTTVLLFLSIAALMAAGVYIHWLNGFEQIETAAKATAEDRADALKNYRLMKEGNAASMRTNADVSTGERVEIVFSGAADLVQTQEIIETLLHEERAATFYFLTGEAEYQRASVELLLENDFRIGLMGSGVEETLTAADAESLVEQLCRSVMSVRSRFGVMLCSILAAEAPEQTALKAAAANGMQEVLVPGASLALNDCTSAEVCTAYLETLPRGTVLRVTLGKDTLQAGEKLQHLLKAMDDSNMLKAAQTEMAAFDAEELPEAMQRVYTTERAVCFTFAGMGNSEELNGVLSALENTGAAALFFIDYTEAAEYETDIRRILAAGHALGIKPTSDLISDEAQILYELRLAEEALRKQYGCEGELMARAEHGKPGLALRRAAAAGGYTVVSNLLDPVQDSHVRLTDAKKVIEGILPAGKRTLQRGEIVHFRMNCYRNSDALLGEVVTALITERSVYPLKALSDVMNNEAYCYTYPLPAEEILPQVADRIYEGQLTGSLMDVFPGRYIGTDWISNDLTLPGFTDEEIAQLDVSGLIENESNMVFLSFDDWGTDAKMTRLLDVLAAHDARATFFIYTENVLNNPNLLRAIAEAGHAVASHTHYHIPLSNTDTTKYGYLPLEAEQVAALREDLVLSYQTMQSIIGDIAVDGVPALTPYFRPPTLALSRDGVEAVYDTGYTWIISGSCSTDDYIATDADSLLRNMLAGTRSGAVLVMHLTDSSIYTADALEMYLTRMEGSPFRFVTVTEALGLE